MYQMYICGVPGADNIYLYCEPKQVLHLAFYWVSRFFATLKMFSSFSIPIVVLQIYSVYPSHLLWRVLVNKEPLWIRTSIFFGKSRNFIRAEQAAVTDDKIIGTNAQAAPSEDNFILMLSIIQFLSDIIVLPLFQSSPSNFSFWWARDKASLLLHKSCIISFTLL